MAQDQPAQCAPHGAGFTIIWAAPILPGQSEGWRRWLQEMIEARTAEYAESRRQLGVHGERIWIATTVHGDLAIVAVLARQPEQVLAQLATSERPFDRWYREQLLVLQGINLTKPLNRAPPELVLEWLDHSLYR